MIDRTMDCDEIWDLLSAYADGETSGDESKTVQTHLSRCASCSRSLAFLQETAISLAMAPLASPPDHLRESILHATIYRPTILLLIIVSWEKLPAISNLAIR